MYRDHKFLYGHPPRSIDRCYVLEVVLYEIDRTKSCLRNVKYISESKQNENILNWSLSNRITLSLYNNFNYFTPLNTSSRLSADIVSPVPRETGKLPLIVANSHKEKLCNVHRIVSEKTGRIVVYNG